MERSSEYHDLATALAELRPAPRADFTAELDALVASGFQRSGFGSFPFAALGTHLHHLTPRRIFVASGGAALAAIAIATVVVAGIDSESESRPVALGQQAATGRHAANPPVQFSKEIPVAPSRAAESSAGSKGANSSAGPETQSAEALSEYSTSLPDSNATVPLSRALRSSSDRLAHRDIERSAEIGLLAEPADVADDSAQVFSAVHDANGIVLRSTTTAGRHAGARFELLIPSARLGDALAAFSAIDEVRSRHEATADITAPTVTASEQLRDSRAKIDSLLAQLSAAETESESEAIERELRFERRHAAGLRAQLDKLNQRADFSRVSLKIETGASEADSNSWGIDDAFGDAGRILGVAAGITLIVLAVIAPIALILLLAWLAHRLWLRTRRERALDA